MGIGLDLGGHDVSVSDEYLAYVLEQLEEVGPVEAKRMFGGAGIYCRRAMFALVADDVLYLKVDDSNRADFEDVGAEAFQPFPDKSSVMPYYEVPADILEARDRLATWAQKALRVALRKRKK
jgi:DNA transformation protein and related proteins